jgi:polar amino acid transport system substrate-binding protein
MSDHLRATRACLLAALLAPAFPACAGGQPACPGPISVGLYDSGVLYDPGKGRGIDKDVIDELARRSGCRLVTAIYPSIRIWTMLENGQLDMTVSAIGTPERARFARFVNYIAVKNMVIVSKKTAQSHRDWQAFMDDGSMSIGVVRSFKYSKFYDAQLEQLKVQGRVGEVADLAQVAAQFKKQRWSAVLSHSLFYPRYFTPIELEEQYVVVDWSPGEKPAKAGLAFGRQRFDAAEVAKWQGLITQMRDDGTLRKIFAAYLPKAEVERVLAF